MIERRAKIKKSTIQKRRFTGGLYRKKAQDIRDIIEEGRDPVAERRKQNNPPPTFENAAQQVFKENTPAWRNDKHAAQWLSAFKKYAFPKLVEALW